MNLNAGGMLNNSATLTNAAGHTQANAGTLQNKSGATLSNLSGGTFNNAGTLTNTGALNNAGTLNNTGTLTSQSGATVTNTGTLSNQSGSALTNSGSFTNSGTVQGLGTFTQTAGVSQIGGSFAQSQINIQGGQLFGNGTMTGPVLNTGGIVQGGAAGSPGMLSINGSFTQQAGGTLHTLINGTGAGQSSILSVTGPITLAGTLDLTTGGGFSFAAGQTFTLASFNPGGLTGSFDNLVYGTYSGSGASLNIGGGLELDVLYNNGLGNIQLSVANIAAVPEPADSALMLAGLALVGWMARRRKQAAASANRV